MTTETVRRTLRVGRKAPQAGARTRRRRVENARRFLSRTPRRAASRP